MERHHLFIIVCRGHVCAQIHVLLISTPLPRVFLQLVTAEASLAPVPHGNLTSLCVRAGQELPRRLCLLTRAVQGPTHSQQLRALWRTVCLTCHRFKAILATLLLLPRPLGNGNIYKHRHGRKAKWNPSDKCLTVLEKARCQTAHLVTLSLLNFFPGHVHINLG